MKSSEPMSCIGPCTVPQENQRVKCPKNARIKTALDTGVIWHFHCMHKNADGLQVQTVRSSIIGQPRM